MVVALLRWKFGYFVHKKMLHADSWEAMEGIQTKQSIHIDLEVSLKSLIDMITQASQFY